MTVHKRHKGKNDVTLKPSYILTQFKVKQLEFITEIKQPYC